MLLNTFWGVIWFNAWDEKKWLNIFLVVASHLLVSLMVCIVRVTVLLVIDGYSVNPSDSSVLHCASLLHTISCVISPRTLAIWRVSYEAKLGREIKQAR